jgi:hypothetical protein
MELSYHPFYYGSNYREEYQSFSILCISLQSGTTAFLYCLSGCFRRQLRLMEVFVTSYYFQGEKCSVRQRNLRMITSLSFVFRRKLEKSQSELESF